MSVTDGTPQAPDGSPELRDGSTAARPPRAGAPLTISVVEDQPDGVVRLTARGELDLATADQLEAALSAQLDAGRHTTCLDLAGLSFCAATGLNTLLAAHLAYQDAGRVLILTGCDRHLTRALRLTGLDRVLNTIPAGTPEARDGEGKTVRR